MSNMTEAIPDNLHLGWIHGDPIGWDDVPEVGDGCHLGSTLGALDEEEMPLEGADSVNVAKMVCP